MDTDRSYQTYFRYLRFNQSRTPILKIILRTNVIIPAIINIEPLIIQEGLLYINELEGPISDLDCAVKITPNIISNIPIIMTNIFKDCQINNENYLCICYWDVFHLHFITSKSTKIRKWKYKAFLFYQLMKSVNRTDLNLIMILICC